MDIHEEIRSFFDVLTELTDNYIYMCDMKTGTFTYSPQQAEVFGLPGLVLENPLPIWKKIVHPQDWDRFYNANINIGKNGRDFHSIHFRAKAFDGDYVLLKCRGKVIRDENGEPFLFTGIMTELGSENKRDSFNARNARAGFHRTLDRKCAEMSGREEFAVVKIDIDNLRVFNEMYGRVTGDFIIQRVEELIDDVLQEKGRIYRLEANHYGILLNKASVERTEALFAEIQDRLQCDESLNALAGSVSVSAGCVFFPGDADNVDDLLNNCKLALKCAKDDGKNRIAFYEASMWESQKRSFQMKKYLEQGVKDGFSGFYLHYQPQIDTETKAIKGVEALLRFDCPEVGQVSPVEFIPVLEKSGLIVPVGAWVLRQAVRAAKKWLPLCPGLLVSVNVSLVQIKRSDFVGEAKRILEEEQVSAGNIVLELTETNMVENAAALNSVLQELREMGFGIAIDDFGTGYSSLGILKHLPADTVKLDRVFVHNIQEHPTDKAFIRSITELCHCLGMKVLLEGVETAEEFDEIKYIGLDYIQGFLFGMPQEETQITGLLG